MNFRFPFALTINFHESIIKGLKTYEGAQEMLPTGDNMK